ncbi:MAG: hypothetical protein OQK80_09775, partial [Sedimenticola sp.]|nr:hypothetical protein [Sedimenticola sp.]
MTTPTALDTETITALLQNAADSQQWSLDSASLHQLLEQTGLPVSVADSVSGNALCLSLRNTREFGQVITVGLGGDQGELLKNCLLKGQHSVSA